VRQNVILTAAHCVCYSPEPSANYPTGGFCKNGDQNTAPAPLLDASRWMAFFQYGGLRRINRVEINEGYEFEDTAVSNDLALLVLSHPVHEINPPTLPAAQDAAPAWLTGVIVGFGYSANPGAPTAAVLEQLVMPGLKAQGTVSSAPYNTESYLDPATSLCSVYAPSGSGSQATVCSGDSGGPLWLTDSSDSEIGVTSGRNNSNCAAGGTVSFQMSTAYRGFSNWITAHLATYASATVAGRWPTFGQNVRHVLDKRLGQLFEDDGTFESQGWMTTNLTDGTLVLGTMNSSGRITHFELRARDGKTLCQGVAGAAKNTPNVDYCWASIGAGEQFHVVATGTPNEPLQFVITMHAADTSFAQ
jgi:hypothetical protein